MSFRDLKLKKAYRSYKDNFIEDLLSPLLAEAIRYDRIVGFFSSEALYCLKAPLSSLVRKKGTIRLIIGHPLSEEEYDAVLKGSKELFENKINEVVLSEIERSQLFSEQNSALDILSWLVANDIAQIKFAALTKSRCPKAMMHEKTGILKDSYENIVVIDGSPNESLLALGQGFNREKITVHYSWEKTDFEEYVSEEVLEFEESWNDAQSEMSVVPLPSLSYERLVKIAPTRFPSFVSTPPQSPDPVLESSAPFPRLPVKIGNEPYNLMEHQKSSLQKWQKTGGYQGILALCTGSGKTITSLHAATVLANEFKANGSSFVLIVAVPYQILAEQWCDVMALFGIEPVRCWGGEKSWSQRLAKRLSEFDFSPGTPDFLSIVVVNKTLRENQRFSSLISQLPCSKMLFVGDECHHHASPALLSKLPAAKYRIGLSATPWNEGDREAELALSTFYSGVVDSFGIGDALNLGVLCPYEYTVHEVRLSEGEWQEYVDLSRQIAIAQEQAAKGEGREQVDRLLGARARLVGSAKGKFERFAELAPDIQPLTLVYVGDGAVEGDADSESDSPVRDIEKAKRILTKAGHINSQFTAKESVQERKARMRDFADEDIRALVAIRVLDEGFDMPSVKTAFLLASSRSERQFIQRRGRVLRKSPETGKEYAHIHDFIVLPPEGSEGQSSRSLVVQEMRRCYEFARYAKAANFEQLEVIKENFQIDLSEIEIPLLTSMGAEPHAE